MIGEHLVGAHEQETRAQDRPTADIRRAFHFLERGDEPERQAGENKAPRAGRVALVCAYQQACACRTNQKGTHASCGVHSISIIFVAARVDSSDQRRFLQAACRRLSLSTRTGRFGPPANTPACRSRLRKGWSCPGVFPASVATRRCGRSESNPVRRALPQSVDVTF